MEFNLLFGSKKVNKVMKVGRARHAELEKEVKPKAQYFLNFLLWFSPVAN